jgi:HK97 family phage major capsid protein
MNLTQYLRRFYPESRNHDGSPLSLSQAKKKADDLFKRGELFQGVWGDFRDGHDVPEAKIHTMRRQLFSHHPDTDSTKDFDMPTAKDTTVSEALHTAAYNGWGIPDPREAAPRSTFGGPNVKRPSDRYSEKRYIGHHKRTGKEVFHEGQAVTLPSEKNHALAGTYFRHLLLKRGADIRPLDEHERELLKEIYNDHDWVGDVGGRYYPGAKLETIYGKKGSDLIGDSTSGGDNIIPYFFDVDLVTFPLLNNELFPYVTIKDLTWSNSIHTASIGNPTVAWSSSEGSEASIALQTTDGLIASITANVYNVAAAITIGRDFMNDSPVAVGEEINKLFGQRYAAELDKVIAIGDGVTQPQGLENASGTVPVSATNSTAGPFLVKDVENMISALPKQYRAKEPSVCWVMPDAAWFKLRGISVSSTDQRRIFGYAYEDYTLCNRPVRISNDLPHTDIFYLKLALYRMWRRMGLQIQTSLEGKTLLLDNEFLIVARGRFAGKLMDGGGCAFMANAPLH